MRRDKFQSLVRALEQDSRSFQPLSFHLCCLSHYHGYLLDKNRYLRLCGKQYVDIRRKFERESLNFLANSDYGQDNISLNYHNCVVYINIIIHTKRRLTTYAYIIRLSWSNEKSTCYRNILDTIAAATIATKEL